MEEELIKPIDVMTDDELISIITIKKDNYNDDYRNRVLNELNDRGVKLDDILRIVKFKFNYNDFENIDIGEVFEKISLLKKPLDLIYFRNYMAEHFAVQKSSDVFVCHHHNPKIGFNSFFLEDEEELRTSLSAFLSMGNWLPEETEIIKHWETFTESSSEDYILRLAKMLDEINLYYSLNTNNLARFGSFSNPYSIVLPAEDMEEAQEVLIQLEDLKNDLHKKMELAEAEEDSDKQLEILTELESVTPDDSVLYYNKAQLLDEKGKYQEASDALIDSFNLDLANGTVDDIADIENYLSEMLEKVESKTNILHCLASISGFRGENENALKFYNDLIELDEKDPIAHLNLGHLYYSHFEDDDKVRLHFQKFKELEPNSEESESIEAILKILD
jgi:tetratricopeptide (TPR) repeat protein